VAQALDITAAAAYLALAVGTDKDNLHTSRGAKAIALCLGVRWEVADRAKANLISIGALAPQRKGRASGQSTGCGRDGTSASAMAARSGARGCRAASSIVA